MEQQEQQGMEMIKAVYDDGFAEINGREYHFLDMRHQQRRSVFAFFSSIQRDIQRQDFSFLDDPRFKNVEKIIESSVSIDDSLLAKLPNHWEDYPQDYLKFVSTALAVISYPFMPASATGSQSPGVPAQKTSSKKPI
jgi:hypothetical protein